MKQQRLSNSFSSEKNWLKLMAVRNVHCADRLIDTKAYHRLPQSVCPRFISSNRLLVEQYNPMRAWKWQGKQPHSQIIDLCGVEPNRSIHHPNPKAFGFNINMPNPLSPTSPYSWSMNTFCDSGQNRFLKQTLLTFLIFQSVNRSNKQDDLHERIRMADKFIFLT